MNAPALRGARVLHFRMDHKMLISRKICDRSSNCHNNDNGFDQKEEPVMRLSKTLDFDSHEFHPWESSGEKRRFLEKTRTDAARILDILQRDGPGSNAKATLSELDVHVSGLLVREVLVGILRNLNSGNKSRFAKLGYKFFSWSGQQKNYKHTANTYHLIMEILADCEEHKAMWRLVDEMIENGYPTTARTFNILICSCCETGLSEKIVERFIKSKNFNYRPFKHSYNAILHTLLVIHQYKLIEWVYQQMLSDGFAADILTYNVLLCAKYRLGKLDQFHRFLNEMISNGFPPDFHTYNLLLHIIGKSDKPLAAIHLLNHMKEVGLNPNVLHYTTLMDGLSRAGNLDACRYFFEEMEQNGCVPDNVCYTVMIAGHIAAGALEIAEAIFDEMIRKGQLPNVFTYDSMIRGLCMAGKFDEACCMLKNMQSRGCNPNFHVYNTLVGNLRRAGKLSEAHEIIKDMMEAGKYAHLLSKFTRWNKR